MCQICIIKAENFDQRVRSYDRDEYHGAVPGADLAVWIEINVPEFCERLTNGYHGLYSAVNYVGF